VLILLRHGQTAANAKGLLQGRVDNPLDDVGYAQAAAAAAALGTVDRVIASPLWRTRQTAAALRCDRGVEYDDRLVELDYGDFDGSALGDVSPDMWDMWRSDSSYRLPGGESLDELRSRVWPALDDLREFSAASTVVVVSHMSPIKTAVQWVLGVDVEISWNLHLSTASVTRVAMRGSRAVLHSFNDTAHL